MVDHVSRIPNPGDYFLFNAEKESIILIRGRDNQIMGKSQYMQSVYMNHNVGNKRQLKVDGEHLGLL